LRVRVAVIAVTLLVGLVVAKFGPGTVTWRVRWLTTNHATSADPFWDVAVDGPAFRKAGAQMHRGATYYLWYPPEKTQYSHDLLGAGLLFLTPAVPVQKPSDADWIVSYEMNGSVPPGIRVGSGKRIGANAYLIRVAR
jgi:hypothetical protein